jgi:hypothetical protein
MSKRVPFRLEEKTSWQAIAGEHLRLDRRAALRLAAIAAYGVYSPACGGEGAKDPKSMSDWMDIWMSERAKQSPAERELNGGLYVGRFKDPIYFLTKKISWLPNSGQKIDYQPIDVPVGFVTDFASIPRVFWSMLRPDGEYAYAAVIHDYLYWNQQRSREESDNIFKLAMQDLKIDAITIAAIFQAVRNFGGSAWSDNAKLKANGEKRTLLKFPDDPGITWEEWKKDPGVF